MFCNGFLYLWGVPPLPTTPPLGRNPPQTPGIKCIDALFYSLVNNTVSEQIGRKEGLCKASYVSYDQPNPGDNFTVGRVIFNKKAPGAEPGAK